MAMLKLAMSSLVVSATCAGITKSARFPGLSAASVWLMVASHAFDNVHRAWVSHSRARSNVGSNNGHDECCCNSLKQAEARVAADECHGHIVVGS